MTKSVSDVSAAFGRPDANRTLPAEQSTAVTSRTFIFE